MKTITVLIIILLSFNIYAQNTFPIKEQYDNFQKTIANKNRYLKWNGANFYWDETKSWSSHQLGDGMSKVILSYLTMYRTTGDKAYLIKFINETIKIQNYRYDNQFPNNPAYPPKWTLAPETGLESTYLNALIIMPMAEFVYMVKQNNDLFNSLLPQELITRYSIISTSDIETYGTFANWLSNRLDETMEFLNEYRWCEEWGLMKNYVDCDKNSNEGKTTEINMQGPYAVALLYMALATNNSDYFTKATILYQKYIGTRRYRTKWLGMCIKWEEANVLELQENNSYTLRHSGWKTITGCNGQGADEDISHAIWTFIFPLKAYQVAGFFTEEDMIRFRNTFTKNIWDSDLNGFHLSVYGTDDNIYPSDNNGLFNKYRYSSFAYMPFYEFDALANESPTVYDIVMDFYENDVKDITSTELYANVGGQGFYGLAETVKAQWETEPYNLTLRNRKVVYDQNFVAKNNLVIDPALPNELFPSDNSAFADPTDFTENKFVIEPRVSVTMVAGNSIRLGQGFHAKAGCNFHAYINPSLLEDDKKSVVSRPENNLPFEFQSRLDSIFDENKKLEILTQKDTVVWEYEQMEANTITVFPNPVNEKTNIKIFLLENSNVELQVTDFAGEIVITEKNKIYSAGIHEISLNFNNLQQGIYFCSLIIDNKKIKTEKLIKL